MTLSSTPRFTRYLFLGLLVTGGIILLNGLSFSVPATHMAYVTRFGRVIAPEAGPLDAGLHFKLPFIDHADLLQVSTDTSKLEPIQAYTRDTQQVNVQLSLTYSIPRTAVYHLLYEIGRSGNVDIVTNINAVVNDRVRSVLGQQEIVRVAGEGREQVVGQMKTVIQSELKRLFWLEVHDVQIAAFTFTKAYEESINQATLAKTSKVKAELERDRKRIEAEAAQAEAAGRANAAIEEARGRKASAIAAAEGEAAAITLRAQSEAAAIKARGDAEATILKAKIEAAGGTEPYVKQLQAQAALNWKGEVPTTMLGGNTAAPVPVLPLPTLPGSR
ncbi:MAG: SPFH domain-containing protein [Candidatus Tectimicrobiota bacterium]